MTWRIEWHPQAVRDLRRLSSESRQCVTTALERYAESDYGDVRPLTGSVPPRLRLRAGDIRAIFQFGPDDVLRVLHRREAYR